MRNNQLHKLLILSVLLLSGLTNTNCQESKESADTLRKDAVKIFIDCHRCDMNYIRKEIPYVNYVRDVKEADIYILETRQGTGSGGEQYALTFQGLGKYLGKNDTLFYNSRPDDPRDLTRNGRTQIIKMGLMRHVATTPLFNTIDIGFNGETEEEEVVDKWNYWVFKMRVNGSLSGESLRDQYRLGAEIKADRITEDWKIRMELDADFDEETYKIEDDSTWTASSDKKEGDVSAVKALSDHWSLGALARVVSSTYSNIDIGYELTLKCFLEWAD